MDELMIFMVGFIAGLFVMGIIAAASNIRWSCRDKEDKND